MRASIRLSCKRFGVTFSFSTSISFSSHFRTNLRASCSITLQRKHRFPLILTIIKSNPQLVQQVSGIFGIFDARTNAKVDCVTAFAAVNEGAKTWATITGAYSASPAKKADRTNSSVSAQPSVAQFQQPISQQTPMENTTAKPQRAGGPRGSGRSGPGAEGTPLSPNENRGSYDRRSNRGGPAAYGSSSPVSQNQQPTFNAMNNIGVYPPKSESPSGGFQPVHPANQGPAGGNRAMPTFGGGPGSHQQAPDECQIFVGNLPQDVSQDELRRRFIEFGNVIDIRINNRGNGGIVSNDKMLFS